MAGYGDGYGAPGYEGRHGHGYGEGRQEPGYGHGFGEGRQEPGYGQGRQEPAYGHGFGEGTQEPGYGQGRQEPAYGHGYGEGRQEPGYGQGRQEPAYGHGYGEGRQEPGYGQGVQAYASGYGQEGTHGHGSSYGGQAAGYNPYNQLQAVSEPQHQVQGKPMTIFCEANPDFSLTVRGGRPVLAPAKKNDPFQQWIEDGRWGSKVKDEAGFPAFALINKGNGLALKHGNEMNEEVTLHPYDPNSHDESLLWTLSAEVGDKGFKCIRPVGNIHLNLDAYQGTQQFGGLNDGTPLILFKWKKQENQKWKIVPSPIAGSDPASGYNPPGTHTHQAYGSDPTSGYGPPGSHPHQAYGGYPPQQQHAYQNPESQHQYGGDSQYGAPSVQGQAVKLFCEARPEFFVTARSDGVVLAPGDQSDIRQIWIKDDRWSTKVKDEAGFPAFSLIHKASQRALKHGKAEFDEVDLTSYNPNQLDESILWTESADVGHGYKCIRPVDNIHINLDASHGDLKRGGVHDGTKLILFKWRKHENQKWKMTHL